MTPAPAPAKGAFHTDRDAVAALLARQLPDAAGMDLTERRDGTSAIMWRAGKQWAVRLPRDAEAEARMATELDWLPRIARQWTFPASAPAWVGRADAHFPHRWAIAPWIDGEPATTAPLTAIGARSLGAALRELHQPAPPDAPRSPVRSTTLVQRLPALTDLVARAAAVMPAGFSLDTRSAALALESGARVPRPIPTWTHLRIDGDTVLTRDGDLAGIVGWSGAGAADPAIDLAHALVLVGGDLWDALFEGYGGIDVTLFARARAEATAHACALSTAGGPLPRALSWLALSSLGLLEPVR